MFNQQFKEDGLMYPALVCEYCGKEVLPKDGVLIWNTDTEPLRLVHKAGGQYDCILHTKSKCSEALDVFLIRLVMQYMNPEFIKPPKHAEDALMSDKTYKLSVPIPSGFWTMLAIR
ncbi:hypothetical protein LCGC14_1799340 [marine sediment metagenome]|uniref:Uncharacterized protein n=1 Tax=marine sediment metagenome TaxID=412755 RepID=A0A0F9J4V7_9ZZZZ